MKKIVSVILTLALLFSCITLAFTVSAEETLPFEAYDGSYAIKIDALPENTTNCVQWKLGLWKQDATNVNSITVTAAYRLAPGAESITINPQVVLYTETDWGGAVWKSLDQYTITADKWTYISKTVDIASYTYIHDGGFWLFDKGDKITSDLYIDKVSMTFNTWTNSQSFEDGGTGDIAGVDNSTAYTYKTLKYVEPAEEKPPFPAYDGEFALKIGKYDQWRADGVDDTTVKLNLDDLKNSDYLADGYKFYISATYRLGEDGVEDNGIRPFLRFYYHDAGYSVDYSCIELANCPTITSNGWTTISGYVDATAINGSWSWEDNIIEGVALLFHGLDNESPKRNERKANTDLYVDNVIVKQVIGETENVILEESFEGLYDSNVTFPKNKVQGEFGKTPALTFERLGYADDSFIPIDSTTQTVYEGKKAVKVNRNSVTWNSGISFEFWNNKIITQKLSSLDFNVNAKIYAEADMNLFAELYIMYDGGSFDDPITTSSEVAVKKGDWVDFNVDLSTSSLDNTKTIGRAVIFITERTQGKDFAIDNLKVTSSLVGSGATDLASGYGDFEGTNDEKNNLFYRTNNPKIGTDVWLNKGHTDKGYSVTFELVEGPVYTEVYKPFVSSKIEDLNADDGSFSLKVSTSQPRSRYTVKEYGAVFHRSELLGENELTLETEGAQKNSVVSTTLPLTYEAVLADAQFDAAANKVSKGYANTSYTGRPYVTYTDSVTQADVTFYGEQVTNRSNNYKAITLGDFVNKDYSSFSLASDNNYVLTSDTVLTPPTEGTVFDIKLNQGYKVGFIASPTYSLNYGDDGDTISKGIVKWFGNGDKFSLHYLYIYFRVFVTREENIDSEGNLINTYEITDIAETGLELKYVSTSNVLKDNADKIKEINSLRKNNAVLTHASDIHADVTRLDNMLTFSDSIGADMSLVTGDITAYRYTTGFTAYTSVMQGRGTPVLAALGNHDVGFTSSTAQSDTDIYNALLASAANEYGYQNNKAYYYKDDTEHKLRVIVLNNYERDGVAVSEYWTQHINVAQLQFLADTLNATPEGYSVLLAYHTPYNNDTNKSYTTDITAMIDLFKGRQSGTVAGNQYDFTNASATFVAHVTGHTHSDYADKIGANSNQLMITVSCAAATKGVLEGNSLAQNSGIIRNKTDKSQDLFNSYIIDTDNQKVIVVRVGADVKTDGTQITTQEYNY